MYIVDLVLKLEDGLWHRVDIDKSTVFPFNFQISQLKNPTVTKIPYSTQITIPKTKNNVTLFSHPERLDGQVLNYNAIRRTEFRLHVDNTIFQTGYIKMENETRSEYKIRLYGGLGEFFYLADQITLRELGVVNGTETEFGQRFRHRINREFIRRAWSSSLAYRYIDQEGNEKGDMRPYFGYAMTYQGQYDNFDSEKYVNGVSSVGEVTWYSPLERKEYGNVELNEHRRTGLYGSQIFYGEYRSYYQRPMIAVKEIYKAILDRLTQEGWTYELDETFFNQYNPYWYDLWMICSQYNIENGDDNPVTVGVDKDITFDEWHGTEINSEERIKSIGELQPNPSNDMYVLVSLPIYLYVPWHMGSSYVDNKKETFTLTCEIKIGDKRYPLNWEYDGNNMITLDRETVTIRRTRGEDMWIRSLILDEDTHDGRVINTIEQASLYNLLTKEIHFPAGSINNPTSIEVIFTGDGDTWWRNGPNTPKNAGLRVRLGNEPEGGQGEPEIIIKTSSNVAVRSNTVITWDKIIQTNDTCLNFLMSFGKIFDLFYVKDEDKKRVRIMTRNTYYGEQKRLDWTHKIDYSREELIEPVPFDYRTGIMNWGSLGSKYEDQYLSKTSKEYGSARYDTGYHFGTEETDIMSPTIFNNCVVANDYSQYFLNRADILYKDNKTLPHFQDNSGAGVDANNVLVFREGISSTGDKPFIITDDNEAMNFYGYAWTNASGSYVASTTYPKLTRIVERNGELFSLNFGRPSISWNEDESLTSDDSTQGGETLYSRFWHDYLRDRFSQNNKRLTLYVDLSRKDINMYLLNKFIFIRNTCWIIERIYNYSPTTPETTKVALIAVKDTNAYISQRYIAGRFIMRYNGQYIYDSKGDLASQNSPVVIRVASTAGSVQIDITADPASLEWKVNSYATGIPAVPAAGAGSGSFRFNLPANTTGKTYSFLAPVKWGNSTTIVQIIQNYTVTVTASAENGIALINGQASPQQVEAGSQVTFTTIGDNGYSFTGWLINGNEYPDMSVTITVTEDTDAVALWTDVRIGWEQVEVRQDYGGWSFTNNLYVPDGMTANIVAEPVNAIYEIIPSTASSDTLVTFRPNSNSTAYEKTTYIRAQYYEGSTLVSVQSFTLLQTGDPSIYQLVGLKVEWNDTSGQPEGNIGTVTQVYFPADPDRVRYITAGTVIAVVNNRYAGNINIVAPYNGYVDSITDVGTLVANTSNIGYFYWRVADQ